MSKSGDCLYVAGDYGPVAELSMTTEHRVQ